MCQASLSAGREGHGHCLPMDGCPAALINRFSTNPHVCRPCINQVTPASESLLLNQQRLELALNHRGTVLSVNPGASKAVFGVEPSELVGKSLSSFINVFGQWKAKYGSEEGLLTKLALRVEQSHDVVVRCGLHNPFSEVRGCMC